MTLNELVESLQKWQEIVQHDPKVVINLTVVTNSPSMSRGDITKIICGAEPKKGITEITLFGRRVDKDDIQSKRK